MDAGSIYAKALTSQGMVAFFCLIGSAARTGQSVLALRALKATGLAPAIAWHLVDRWEAMEQEEREIGSTPEARAMLLVVASNPSWSDLPWVALTKDLFGDAVPQ